MAEQARGGRRRARSPSFWYSGVAQLSRRNARRAAGCWTPRPAKISQEETIKIAGDYDFVVLFTSNVGFQTTDVSIARRMKEAKPDLKIAFVGPHVRPSPTNA